MAKSLPLLKGATTGQVSFANPNQEDIYQDASSHTYTVTQVAGGGRWHAERAK